MSISKEIIDGSIFNIINPGPEPGRADLRKMYSLTRCFKVTELSSSSYLGRMSEASLATIPHRVPQLFEPHGENNYLWVTNVQVKLLGPTTAIVTCEYSYSPFEDPPIQVDIGTLTTQLEYELDYKNAPLPKITKAGIDYFGRYPTEIINPIVRVSKYGFSKQQAVYEVKTYSNSVSDGGPLGGTARTWRCMVSARPSGLADRYAVDYEFAYDPNSWDAAPAYFSRAEKQLKPIDVPENQRFIQRYRTVAFPAHLSNILA